MQSRRWLYLEAVRVATRQAMAVLFTLGLAAPAVAQSIGVQGRVWDGVTGEPIGGALIALVGGETRAETGPDGAYLLSLPAGSHTIRATRIGYVAQSRSVTVPPRQVVTIDFTLVRIDPQSEDAALIVPAPLDTVPTRDLSFSIPDSLRLRHRQMVFQPFAPVVGDTISLWLFDDTYIRVRSDRITIERDGFKWVGRVLDAEGPPRGSVILIVRDGRLTGDIRFDGRVVQILPYSGRLHIVLEVDLTRGTPIDETDVPLPLPRPGPPDPLSAFVPDFRPYLPLPIPIWYSAYRDLWAVVVDPDACSDLRNLMAGPWPDIRVMVVYTDEVAANPLGDIESEIEIMIERTNQALENSRIPQRITLAHTAEVLADDTGLTGMTTQRDRLQDPTDGHMDTIHTWRDEQHADIVILLVEHAAGGGKAFIMESVTLDFAPWAFAAVNRGMGLSHLTFPHELGHVMGAQHERGAASILMKPYHYNHGLRVAAENVTTVMANPPAGSMRIDYFSNPATAYNGSALGLPSTDPDAADNHRAFINTASVVSAFRLTPVWLASAGAAAPWQEKRVLPAGETPVLEVRFGDFNGDGESDAFRVDMATGTWYWSRSAAEPWAVLNGPDATLAVPVADLGFADFNNDGTTDVFRSDVAGAQWLWSVSGRAAWAQLNAGAAFAVPIEELAFGQFDSNPGADVFRANALIGEWSISSGGTGAWTTLNGPDLAYAQLTSDLRFGDFNGDGVTDVFRATTATTRWHMSSAGSGTWQLLGMKSEGVTELAFGDFDGNGTTDAFKTDGTNWYVSDGASTGWRAIRQSCHELVSLGFGDFDGDGTTDVLRAGIRP